MINSTSSSSSNSINNNKKIPVFQHMKYNREEDEIDSSSSSTFPIQDISHIDKGITAPNYSFQPRMNSEGEPLVPVGVGAKKKQGTYSSDEDDHFLAYIEQFQREVVSLTKL
jgi:mitochondrial fission protein ELM1